MKDGALTGAARAIPMARRGADLVNRNDYELGQFLCAWPGGGDGQSHGDYTEPLPNVAGFDKLVANGYTPQQVESLVNWIEPFTTCDWIMRHHGAAALKRILRGIAKAAVTLNVPMKSRTRHTAYVCDFVAD
tara:strand:+ start:5361 stop:5756 length:396 start_codon:yes stop_codon:yes gene_type:complete